MERQTMVAKTWFECDACQYPLADPSERPTIEVRVPFDGHLVTRDTTDTLVFHFHVSQTGTDRRDCFRYWAHNPRVMTRSLKQRGLTDDQIDEVLSVMLYREQGDLPGGVERPAASAAS